MKTLLSFTLLIFLTGCASQRPPTAQQVHEQAVGRYLQINPVNEQLKGLDSTIIQLHSHGMLGDVLGMVPGAGNGRQLRKAIGESRAAGDHFFLIIGAAAMLDEVLIQRAVEGQDLRGLTIFYSGAASEERLRQSVEAAGADFQWLAPE